MTYCFTRDGRSYLRVPARFGAALTALLLAELTLGCSDTTDGTGGAGTSGTGAVGGAAGSAGSTGGSAGVGGSSGAGGVGATGGVGGGVGGTGGTGGVGGGVGGTGGGTGGSAGSGMGGSAGSAGSGATGGASGSGGDGGSGAEGGTSGAGGSGGGGPCDGFAAIVSKDLFDQIFPLDVRHELYTYEGMVEASVKFPEFATTGECDIRKREIAAIFGNITRETARLRFAEQIEKGNDYCDEGKSYGCPAGTTAYYGRGPIQLTWNYNYYAAGMELGEDLIGNPSLVHTVPKIAWETGIWFWRNGDESPHAAIVSGAGFGETIQRINGYEECNGGTQPYAQEAVKQRVCSYIEYCGILGVDPGGDLNCGTEFGSCD